MKLNSYMTNVSSSQGDVAAMEILDTRVLWPTVGEDSDLHKDPEAVAGVRILLRYCVEIFQYKPQNNYMVNRILNQTSVFFSPWRESVSTRVT